MVRNLTKMGNDVCLVFDEMILQRLHVTAGDTVAIRFEGEQLVVASANKPAVDPAFTAAVARSNAQYAADFKKLAE